MDDIQKLVQDILETMIVSTAIPQEHFEKSEPTTKASLRTILEDMRQRMKPVERVNFAVNIDDVRDIWKRFIADGYRVVRVRNLRILKIYTKDGLFIADILVDLHRIIPRGKTIIVPQAKWSLSFKHDMDDHSVFFMNRYKLY